MNNLTPEQLAKTLVGHLVEANFISASNDLSDAAFEREQERLEADAYALILPVIREAKSEGAQVERAECIKIFNDYELLSAKAWDEKYRCESVVEVIQARGNQAEGKVGE